jgi:hypothetical protein
LKANPLVKRRSKRKKRALMEGPLLIWSLVRFWIARRLAAGLALFFHRQITAGA